MSLPDSNMTPKVEAPEGSAAPEAPEGSGLFKMINFNKITSYIASLRGLAGGNEPRVVGEENEKGTQAGEAAAEADVGPRRVGPTVIASEAYDCDVAKLSTGDRVDEEVRGWKLWEQFPTAAYTNVVGSFIYCATDIVQDWIFRTVQVGRKATAVAQAGCSPRNARCSKQRARAVWDEALLEGIPERDYEVKKAVPKTPSKLSLVAALNGLPSGFQTFMSGVREKANVVNLHALHRRSASCFDGEQFAKVVSKHVPNMLQEFMKQSCQNLNVVAQFAARRRGYDESDKMGGADAGPTGLTCLGAILRQREAFVYMQFTHSLDSLDEVRRGQLRFAALDAKLAHLATDLAFDKLGFHTTAVKTIQPGSDVFLLIQTEEGVRLARSSWKHSRLDGRFRRYCKLTKLEDAEATVSFYNAGMNSIGRSAQVPVILTVPREIVEGDETISCVGQVGRRIALVVELQCEYPEFQAWDSTSSGKRLGVFDRPLPTMRPGGGLLGGKGPKPKASSAPKKTHNPKPAPQPKKKKKKRGPKPGSKAAVAVVAKKAQKASSVSLQVVAEQTDFVRRPYQGPLGPFQYGGKKYGGSFPVSAQVFSTFPGMPQEFAVALKEYTDLSYEPMNIWCQLSAPSGTRGDLVVIYVQGPRLELNDEDFVSLYAVRKGKLGCHEFDLGKPGRQQISVPIPLVGGVRPTDSALVPITIGHLYYGWPSLPSMPAMTVASGSSGPPIMTPNVAEWGTLYVRGHIKLFQHIGKEQLGDIARVAEKIRVADGASTSAQSHAPGSQVTEVVSGILSPEAALAAANTESNVLPVGSTQAPTAKMMRATVTLADPSGALVISDTVDFFVAAATEFAIEGLTAFFPITTRLVIAGIEGIASLFVPGQEGSTQNMALLEEEVHQLNGLNGVDMRKTTGNPDSIFAYTQFDASTHLGQVVTNPNNFGPVMKALLTAMMPFLGVNASPIFCLETMGVETTNPLLEFTSFQSLDENGPQMLLMPNQSIALNNPTTRSPFPFRQCTQADHPFEGFPIGPSRPITLSSGTVTGRFSTYGSYPPLYMSTNMTTITEVSLFTGYLGGCYGKLTGPTGTQAVSWMKYAAFRAGVPFPPVNTTQVQACYAILKDWMRCNYALTATAQWDYSFYCSYKLVGSLTMQAAAAALTTSPTFSTDINFTLSDFSGVQQVLMGVANGTLSTFLQPSIYVPGNYHSNSFYMRFVEKLMYSDVSGTRVLRDVTFPNPNGTSGWAPVYQIHFR